MTKEDFAKFLGEYLKRGRYELGMTQAEFAWEIHAIARLSGRKHP